MSEPDVVVIGAGAAGLAAAAILRRAGMSVLVLEAGPRIGGRARTVQPEQLGGATIDEGATWLHEAGRNPLVALARQVGAPLHDGHPGSRRLLIGSRVATAGEESAYAEADASWRAFAQTRLSGPDISLAEAGDGWSRAADPWLPNVEAWESAIIAAVDADRISLFDWHRNQLGDDDLRPDRGVGTLLASLMGPLAGPVRCGVTVTAIDWQHPGGVSIATSAGTVRARACIVTVSTGVLRDERIGFAPPLPSETLTALDGLPMGLLSKLALPVADTPESAARLAVDPDTLVEQRLDSRGEAMMLLGVRPAAAPYVTGFFGGRFAWSFCGCEEDALDEARSRLSAMLGAAALDALKPGGFVSRWGSDPLFLGAYAYARPGCADARTALGRPIGDGRLVLAGEACRTDGLAGTVGGAMLDGERAAHSVLASLGISGPWPAVWPQSDS
ncbi:MAG: flavin monoamine oxidase family protein [Janthinobacterium lividum]